MNARTHKELHNLRPALIISGLLLFAALLIGNAKQLDLLTASFWIGCCLIAVAPFARDWSLGGMTLLMAQPISRTVVWNEKLTAAFRGLLPLGLVFLAIACASSLFHWEEQSFRTALLSFFFAPLFVVPVAFWIALRVGDVKASIFLTLLAILTLGIVATQIANILDIHAQLGFILAGLTAVTAPIALRRAERVFHHWEDYHPLRHEYAFNFQHDTAHRATGRLANLCALVSKELHLQQTNFLFIAGLLVCGYLVRIEDYRWGALSMMCSLIALFGPLLLGIGAVCEEHRLEIASQQVTQPSGVARQWWVKYLLVVTLGSLLGGACIWASQELVAGTTHSTTPLSFFKLGLMSTFLADPVNPSYVLLYLGAVAVTTGVGMAIAATFHRYLVSVTIAALLYLAFSLFTPSFTSWAFELPKGAKPYPLYRHTELVVMGIGACLLPVATICGMANLGRLRGNRGSSLSLSLACLAAVIVGAASAHAIYHRAWEKAFPSDKLGLPLVDRDQYASFLPDLRRGIAVDHQGRIWKSTFNQYWSMDPSFHLKDGRPIWKSAVAGFNHYVALDTNGTLWIKGQEEFVRNVHQRAYRKVWKPGFPGELTQIGTDTNWVSLSGDWYTFLAIKTDGSLWSWGNNYRGAFGNTNRAITFLTPQRVDESTDWKQAISLWGQNIALKQDGTLWRWGRWETESNTNGRHVMIQIHSEIPQLLTNQYSGQIEAIRLNPRYVRILARLTNGTVVRIQHDPNESDFRSFGQPENPTVLDPIVDWRIVNPGWSSGYALTVDGRIIERASRPMPPLPDSIDGTHDWVSMETFWGEDESYFLGLKTDGSLWRFRSATIQWYFDTEHRRLPPRWRPKRIGRLFPKPNFEE